MTVKDENRHKQLEKSQRDKWNEMNVPTLTNKIDNQTQIKEILSFDIIEDFIPSFNTATGHQEDCSCIKCQPRQGYLSSSTHSTASFEKNTQPLDKRKYE